jgi:hypothetical protein
VVETPSLLRKKGIGLDVSIMMRYYDVVMRNMVERHRDANNPQY